MAIVGCIVHTLPESSTAVHQKLTTMQGLNTYGIHDGCSIVAVIEAPSHELEMQMNVIKAIDGVIACYVTSLHNDDELD